MLRTRSTIRAFSLIELLIAIAVVIAMSALVLPNVLGRLSEREFERAEDEVVQQLLMARAHAMQTGRPVEVRFVPDEQRAPLIIEGDDSGEPGADVPLTLERGILEARFFRIDAMDAVDLSTFGGTVVDAPVESSTRNDDVTNDELRGVDPDEEFQILEYWASRSLGEHTSMSAQMPEFMRARLEEQSASLDSDSSDAFDAMLDDLDAMVDGPMSFSGDALTARPVRIAVFLPDGSTLLSDPVYLFDRERRCGTITVNPWSGEATCSRLGIGDDWRQVQDVDADDFDDDMFDDEDDESDEGSDDGSDEGSGDDDGASDFGGGI